MRSLLLVLILLVSGCVPELEDDDDATTPADDDDATTPGTDDDDATPQDLDGDGWTVEGGDCDDANPAVHPGADELCDPDDRDEDCDGLADAQDPEGALGTVEVYPDGDGDGQGANVPPLVVCDPPAGTSLQTGDCDDGDPDTWLGAPRRCDLRDNDCDGVVQDNGLVTNLASGVTFSSIQEAIDAAFATNTLHVCPGTYPESLVVDKPLTLLGLAGWPVTIIDANGLGRGVEVTASGAFLGELQFINGVADEGAGLYASGLASLSINEVAVVSGVASLRGGGAFLEEIGTLNVAGIRPLNNHAPEGGGLAVVDCGGSIIDFVARANEATTGAGLLLDVAAPYLADGLVESNVATGIGGGAAVLADVLVEDTDLFENEAAEGGAWAVLSGELSLLNGSALRNVSSTGGALHVVDSATVTNVSWGQGADDNVPVDVSVSGVPNTWSFGASQSFTCFGDEAAGGQAPGC